MPKLNLGTLTPKTTETPWTLWRMQNGTRTLAGEFARKDDALRAVGQLKKLFPKSVYYPEFTGKPISHCGDRGRSVDA